MTLSTEQLTLLQEALLAYINDRELMPKSMAAIEKQVMILGELYEQLEHMKPSPTF